MGSAGTGLGRDLQESRKRYLEDGDMNDTNKEEKEVVLSHRDRRGRRGKKKHRTLLFSVPSVANPFLPLFGT